MMFEENGRNLRLLLYRGEVHEYRPDEEATVRVTHFDVNTIRARDVANALQRSTEIAERGDREMSVCQMMDRRAQAGLEWARVRQQQESYTRKDLRSILVALFFNYGARVRIVYVEAPWREMLERNRARKRVVPETVIRRLARKLEIPTPTEAHEVLYAA